MVKLTGVDFVGYSVTPAPSGKKKVEPKYRNYRHSVGVFDARPSVRTGVRMVAVAVVSGLAGSVASAVLIGFAVGASAGDLTMPGHDALATVGLIVAVLVTVMSLRSQLRKLAENQRDAKLFVPTFGRDGSPPPKRIRKHFR